MADYHLYTNATNAFIDTADITDISNHNGSTKGLSLGGTLCTFTGAQANNAISLSGRIVNQTGASLTLSAAAHEGRIVTLNRALGVAVTLPAATGSGARYRIFIGTTMSGGSSTIKVANASDTMVGFGTIFQDAGNTSLQFEIGGTDDTLTFDGSTMGGIKGDFIELIDVTTNLWYVNELLSGTGAEADNTSATV